MNTANTANIDSILAVSLDDLPDLPEFKVYPAGAHRTLIKFEKKQIGEHPAIEAKFTMVETVELTDPAKDTPVEAGTESSVAFMLDNEFGLGKFKEIMKPFAAHFGHSNLSQLLEEAAGTEVLVSTKVRQNKEKTQSYLDIVSLQII